MPETPNEISTSRLTDVEMQKGLEHKFQPFLSCMVPRGGFEPPRNLFHCPLKTACLPVPPPRLEVFKERLVEDVVNAL